MSWRVEGGHALTGELGYGFCNTAAHPAKPMKWNCDALGFWMGHDSRRKGNTHRKPRSKVGGHRALDLRRPMHNAMECRGPKNVI